MGRAGASRPAALRRVHLELPRSLDPESWRTRYDAGLVPDRVPYGLDRLGRHGWELHVRPASRSRALRLVDGGFRRATGGLELAGSLRSRERRACDVALCWDERTGVAAALRAGIPGEPPVVTNVIWLTEPESSGRSLGGFLAARALRRATAVWVHSAAQLDPLRRGFRVPSSRLHFVPLGIDVDFWTTDGDGPGEGLVVAAGNDRHRDHELVLRAMADVRGRGVGLTFELASALPLEIPAELGSRHASLSHVEMRALYGRASVVALALKPNLHLSGLTVLLEAMACRRPVVVTDSPGLSEYVRSGETAVVVPPGDAGALADAVDALLRDPDRARAIGAAARVAVERRFSTEAHAEGLAEVLQTAV